ncbi:hypothetical protein B9057_02590 [Aestuarium zhoushanense]|nr:hypothetical protein B9057_02590 [Aestuarium zhoushanense]
MIVVQHDVGFAVVELLGSEGEFQVGDVVRGQWDELGSEPVFKDGEEQDAYYQGNWGSLEKAITIARNTGGG